MENKIYDIRKRTYAFALGIIRFIENLPKDYICQILGKQLLRSATSIGANIIEARASSSKRDFINFFSHSLKSANETKF
jgi:four helix bundle protein